VLNPLSSILAINVWECIVKSHPDYASLSVFEDSSSTRTSFAGLLDIFRKTQVKQFRVEFKNGSIHFNYIAHYSIYRVYIVDIVDDEIDAVQWLTPFIQNELLMAARLYDREYDYWQNATDFLQYISRGKAYEHLPKKSNGLPFPLTQEVIDISDNPGRTVLKHGYIEFIGSIMWFGENFWSVSGIDKPPLINHHEYKTSYINSILQVVFDDKVFTVADEVSIVIQNEIRNILYGSINKGDGGIKVLER
jgi:hypothetical protein